LRAVQSVPAAVLIAVAAAPGLASLLPLARRAQKTGVALLAQAAAYADETPVRATVSSQRPCGGPAHTVILCDQSTAFDSKAEYPSAVWYAPVHASAARWRPCRCPAQQGKVAPLQCGATGRAFPPARPPTQYHE